MSTFREWLRQAEMRLAAGHHPDRARRDAETLLLHHIGRTRAWLMAHDDEEFGGCRAVGYAALLDRRSRGEPIQYITAEAQFYGLPFRVTPAVLIPRPETEHLVETAISLCGGLKQPRIVDVGTGSGAIAVAVAHGVVDALITAIDLSNEALEVAKENAARNGVSDRIRFVSGDLLGPVAREQFHVVVSNPPYVPETDQDSLAIEVRDYEPAMALFAGRDGLEVYRRLIPQAATALVTGGCVVLEIGYGQREAVAALLAEAGLEHIEFVNDLQAIPRVACARKPAGLS